MSWEMKSVLTFAAVWAVMAVVRWGGCRLGGLAAALPIVTAPALAWLAHEQGVGFAVDAAIGSVAACAMLAAFALAYAVVARARGALAALTAGLAAAAALSLPSLWASHRLVDALALALVASAVAIGAMPEARPTRAGKPMAMASMTMVSAVAAATSAVAASVGPSMGGFATGLLSSLPLITGAVAMAEHTSAGHGAARRFLAGYASGLFGKAMFGCVFALLAPECGASTALLLGGMTAALVSAVQWRPVPLEAAAARMPR